MELEQVWRSLEDAPWERLSRIHGNCHSSMIGLITQWWVNLSPAHYALDGAPGYISRRNADAILCVDAKPAVVVEVEGYLYLEKVETIGHYLDPAGRHSQLDGLHFGLLVMYPIEARKEERETDLLLGGQESVIQCLAEARRVSTKPGCDGIIVIAVDKRYDPEVPPVRQISGYHRSSISRVRGIYFAEGRQVVEPVVLWRSRPA